ncbi:Uncharacterised protein [Pandoraea pnomenusa]|jgi:hypothetical protein|uniref:Uncharacterized protein n=1 Tax=Pandoraea pnomenusa TaxID=93220 RepID=A0A378YKQ2_9BURK|nr:Uncharacterised protein [Pandoraea pnomenusa]
MAPRFALVVWLAWPRASAPAYLSARVTRAIPEDAVLATGMLQHGIGSPRRSGVVTGRRGQRRGGYMG